MCASNSPPVSNEEDLDFPYLPSIKEPEPNMHTPSILNSRTPPKPQQTTLLPLAIKEAISIAKIAFPMILTSLLLYPPSMISMLFLGRLGEVAFAGGSLAVGFANITGYCILSGLPLGMEPICGQAFGAQKHNLLGLTLQRTMFLLIFTSLPISVLWLNMKSILLFGGQDVAVAKEAQTYLLYSLPDLVAHSVLHPLTIYLRTQSITLPLTFCATLPTILHIPINHLLVTHLNLGIKGVALSGVWTSFNLVGSLIIYILISGVHKEACGGFSMDQCFKESNSHLNLAIQSCLSVCLEWWWYEIMILLCGLQLNPKAAIASMGILIQTTALIYIFRSSLSSSVSTRVGKEIGANQAKKAKLAALVGLCCSFLVGFLALSFTLEVRQVWPTMFTQDKEIIALTSLVLPIIGLCELCNCLQTTGCAVLRRTARPKAGVNIKLGCFYLVGILVAVWLGYFAKFDFEGLWLGLLVAQSLCVGTMLSDLSRTDWDFEAKRAQEGTAGMPQVVGNPADDSQQEKAIKKRPKLIKKPSGHERIRKERRHE